MDALITQLTNFGFSKELALKAISANGVRNSSRLVNWIVSHINDPYIQDQQELNYMVMLSFSPTSYVLQHYLKQIYNLIADHVDFYPTTCEYYFSYPITPILKVANEKVDLLMEKFESFTDLAISLSQINVSLEPFISDTLIGCAVNEEIQKPIQDFTKQFLEALQKENIVDQTVDTHLYTLFHDEQYSKITNNQLIFPILTSIDPLISCTNSPSVENLKSLKDALIESLDMQFKEFSRKIHSLLNTISMPLGAPTDSEEQNCEGFTASDFTINLFSFDDRLKLSKVYRPLVSYSVAGREAASTNMSDPYVYVHNPFADNVFDFQASNYDDLTPNQASAGMSQVPEFDDMIIQTYDEQKRLKEYEKDLEKKPKDHHLLRPIWKSRVVHGLNHRNGLPVSATRDSLQRVPQICAWNLIDTLPIPPKLPTDRSPPVDDDIEANAKLLYRQANNYLDFVPPPKKEEEKVDDNKNNDQKYGNLDKNQGDSGHKIQDKPDGAPTRKNRILSKVDFYRMFTKFQEGNQYQPEKVPEWWAVAKPDYTIDFVDERHHVKHRYLIARHGERTDQIFGSDWYVEVFDSETSHHYRQRDLNEPRFLPRRKTGLKEFFRDAPLSEVGMFEAYLTGQYMKKLRLFETLNWVYTSPSLRSIQTCNYILKGLGLNEVLKMRIEPALFEWYGWYRDYCPTFMSPQRLKNCGFNVDTKYSSLLPEIKYNPEETLEDYYARGEKFMRIISKKHDQQAGDILIVGHGATLDTCTRTLLNKPIRDMQSFNELLRKTPYLAVTRIDEFFDGSWVWPRTPPSLPITYLENMSYDWKILTKNKIKNVRDGDSDEEADNELENNTNGPLPIRNN